VGITHFEEARRRELRIGHLHATWSFLGEAAGCVAVGVRRIEVPQEGWSTPAHEHGRQEEIFYVLAGRGLSWQDGHASEIGAGDCIVYHAGGGAHTLHATGYAMGVQRDGLVGTGDPTRDTAVVTYFGDGATSQGDFLEALNFAGIFNAQAILFIQNNHWAISVPRSRQTASETLAQKGLAQGVTGVVVDGNDPPVVGPLTSGPLAVGPPVVVTVVRERPHERAA